MKHYVITFAKALTLMVVFSTSVATSSAGWFSTFRDPPVSLSMRMNERVINVTNTSDETIHSVSATLDDGKTLVLADTIEPHKTVSFSPPGQRFAQFLFKEVEITCKDYGKMTVKIPVQ